MTTTFRTFTEFCSVKNSTSQFLEVLKIAASKAISGRNFVNKILEPCYFQEWETHSDFIESLNNRISLINEDSSDAAKRIAAMKEKHYAYIIKATKDSFKKLLDKMHFKAAIDMDAQGSDPEAIKKRFIIKDLYNNLLKFVDKYDTQFELTSPEEKANLRSSAENLQTEFEKGVMPYINQYLKTNIDPRYDSYNTIMDKIQGAPGVRRASGTAKDALARKIYAALRKEGMEPMYRRKIELLARAIGAEPRTLEQIRQERAERNSEAAKAAKAEERAELDRRLLAARAEEAAALARGDTRYSPDLDKALGL